MDTAKYIFLNGCDGTELDLRGRGQSGVGLYMTKAEVRERVLQLAEQNPGVLVRAYCLTDAFDAMLSEEETKQFLDGEGLSLKGVREPNVPESD